MGLFDHKPKTILTKTEKHMYAAETATNFRWLAQLLATHSTRVLGDDDLVDSDIQSELADIGSWIHSGSLHYENLSGANFRSIR